MYEKRIMLVSRSRTKSPAGVRFSPVFVKKNQDRLVLQASPRSHTMKEIKLEFQDDDTLPDRLLKFAQLHQTTAQEVIESAIFAYLGDFGLNPISENSKSKNIRDLATERGLFKSSE